MNEDVNSNAEIYGKIFNTFSVREIIYIENGMEI
jgi:hypothetical protein